MCVGTHVKCACVCVGTLVKCVPRDPCKLRVGNL